VCAFIGAQAWVDTSKHGGRNPLLDAAGDIDIFGKAESELDAIRGPKVADRLEDDPRLGYAKADPEKGVEAANSAGSFEAFMTMFGGPPPIPGREAAN
jgi:hypothetical protein